MTDGRRGFLAKLPIAAAALASGGLAGCATTGNALDADDLPSYAGYLYDPSPLMSVDNRVYATFDVASLYEHRDLLPAGLFETFDAVDGALDTVDVDELGHTTMIAYSKFDPAKWSTNAESALSMVVTGSFDADAIQGELDEISGVTDAGTHDDHRIHTTSFDWDLGSLGEHTASVSLASSEDSLVLGVTFDLAEDEDPLETVMRPLDANAGDADTVADASADASVLIDALGETTFGLAFDVRRDLLDNVVDSENESLDAAAKTVVGLGLDLDFDGDDLRGDTLVVFEDEAAASDADVEALLTAHDPDALSDADVSTDGRVTKISASVDAEALWREYWPDVELGDDDESS